MLADFSASTLIETSGTYDVGWAKDSYEELRDGQTAPLELDSQGRGVQDQFTEFVQTQYGTVTTQWFFVGTPEELKVTRRP